MGRDMKMVESNFLIPLKHFWEILDKQVSMINKKRNFSLENLKERIKVYIV